MNKSRRWELLAVACLFAFALALRLFRLPEIPPGLYYDENSNGLDVLDILAGQPSIFLERSSGREPFFIYFQALLVWLFGPSAYSLRLASALIGAATVPALYWMVKEAFRTSIAHPRRLAFWSALLLATSYWHLNFSRIGFRAISFPLFACLALALFWRAWREIDNAKPLPWPWLIVCGAAVGGSLYTYSAARFLPLLVAALAVASALMHRADVGQLNRRLAALAVIAGVALLVFAPLAGYFLENPSSFIGRAEDVSVMNPDQSGGDPVGTLLFGLFNTAGMFAITVDQNLRHNPAGVPVIDPLLAIWFGVGLILCTRRWRSLPHAFLLAALLTFVAPAVLAADGTPHYLRSLAMAPVVLTVCAVAMMAAADLTARWSPRLAPLVPLPFLLVASVTSAGAYFGAPWQGQPLQYAFQAFFRDAGITMTRYGTGGGLWVLPVHRAVDWQEPPTSSYPLEFLYRGVAPYVEVRSDPGSAPAQLADAAAGLDHAYLVSWKDSETQPEGLYLYGDVKGQLEFLLAKHGRLESETDADNLTFKTYSLPTGSDYRFSTAMQAADASFGGLVRLDAFAYGRTSTSRDDGGTDLDEHRVASGETVWAVLAWKAEAQLSRDLRTTLYLADSSGHLAGQIDGLVASDEYPFPRPGTSGGWGAGESTFTYHILPALPAVAPGRYGLYVGVYDATSGARHAVVSGGTGPAEQALYLGSMDVTPAVTLARVQPDQSTAAAAELAPGLGLIGYDVATTPVSPGDRLPVTLYWEARAAVLSDYVISVRLEDAGGRVVAERQGRPGNGGYATTRWSSGEVVRDWHELVLPATLAQGEYSLSVSVLGPGGTGGRVSLGTVPVSGRPRSYVAPAVRYPLDVRLGQSIRLAGYDLESSVLRPGAELAVTLCWRGEQAIDRSYTVFVHLLDAAGQVRGQHDAVPGSGSLPTVGWTPGEYITDQHSIQLPADLPPGAYLLEVGAYEPSSGARLPVLSEAGERLADMVLLSQTITVIP